MVKLSTLVFVLTIPYEAYMCYMCSVQSGLFYPLLVIVGFIPMAIIMAPFLFPDFTMSDYFRTNAEFNIAMQNVAVTNEVGRQMEAHKAWDAHQQKEKDYEL